MQTRSSVRLYSFSFAALAVACVCFASPASAQYRPRPLNDPPTGEKFHIEASAAYWIPTADMTIRSESLGLAGDQIDLVKDLGLTDHRFPELNLMLRPATSHKFRLQFIPIKYDQSTTLQRSITFNGQLYTRAVQVNSTLDWKAYRFSYEYDFLVKNRGFGGFIIEAKYTDVAVNLSAPQIPTIPTQFAHARAPIPALGGIARVYVVPNISITGEVTGFKLPASIDKRYAAHYVDVDVYATVNFTNYVGAQAGYRSLDVGYLVKTDQGALTLKGPYFGVVVRY